MKIGILTLHESNNFGAVLQAYALQKTLEKLNVSAEFVSFKEEKTISNQTSKIFSIIKSLQKAKEKRDSLFEKFRKKHLNCAEIVDWNESVKTNDIYDKFIVGSDQVWNWQIPEVDQRFFLPFANPEKRFSYAASFGTQEIPDKFKLYYKKELSLFQKISVREQESVRLVKDLTGKDATVCIDPVFLPDIKMWDEVSDGSDCGQYVLLFLLNYDELLVKRAKQYAKESNLDIKIVTASLIPPLGIDSWCNVGVEDWLSLIKKSQCVWTNSFHGVAFSVIFARPFFVSELTGPLSTRNGRIRELLKKTGTYFDVLNTSVDIKFLGESLLEERKKSLDYLKTVIQNGTL